MYFIIKLPVVLTSSQIPINTDGSFAPDIAASCNYCTIAERTTSIFKIFILVS